MQKKEVILEEEKNLIKEHLEVDYLKFLKERKLIHHKGYMVIWRFQIQATSKQIKDYYKKNNNIMGMISRGVQNIMAFLEETIESYGLTYEE